MPEKKQVISGQISQKLIARVDKEAAQHFRTRSSELEFIITQYFEQKEASKRPVMLPCPDQETA
jgi:metal-responsive CopG/Arc/MetJ family transcriptional regulator